MISNSALTQGPWQVLGVVQVPLAASSPYIVENGTKIFDVSQHITKGRIRSFYFKEELWTNFNELQLGYTSYDWSPYTHIPVSSCA